MWTLIVMTVTVAYGGVSTTTVDGFTTRQACLSAGNAYASDAQDLGGIRVRYQCVKK